MSIVFAILVVMLLLFAALAIRAKHLISSAIFLAVVSALLSIAFYWLGSLLAAVIELSVGAGLVTVLFVYAINIAGETGGEYYPLIKKWLAGPMVIIVVALLAIYLLPVPSPAPQATETDLANVIWDQRAVDILVQIVLIFSGVLGLLGLLAEAKAPLKYPVAEQVAAQRQQDLDELTIQTPQEEVI